MSAGTIETALEKDSSIDLYDLSKLAWLQEWHFGLPQMYRIKNKAKAALMHRFERI